MDTNILKKMKADIHEKHMHCAQFINWIPEALGIKETDNAFIVQKLFLEQNIDDKKETVQYFEAWEVINGVCCRDNYTDYDDIFCVGHPLDFSDAIKESIGHKGKVLFKPAVYVVRKGNILYDEIQKWPTDKVIEARGLKAVYYSDDLAAKFYDMPVFRRDIFEHKWEFCDKNIIYEYMHNYCKRMWKPENNLDKRNCESFVDDIFKDTAYLDVKENVIKNWYKNAQ